MMSLLNSMINQAEKKVLVCKNDISDLDDRIVDFINEVNEME